MKYYQFQDSDGPLGDATTYIEVDDGWTIRQITVSPKETHASNIKYPKWGMILADQQVNYDSEESVTSIAKDEFDSVWNKHLANRANEWSKIKEVYKQGKPVKGYIIIFYPQGVIVELVDGVLGVADYQACKNASSPENMYPNHEVTAIVNGYDELNQWIKLDSPQVSSILRPPKI